ncbi:MAG: HAMP domain-containing protein [Verrucomicrobia bacterium]|nr:HAMP domain-containing protein [Verrucomicrobiota bacterium]
MRPITIQAKFAYWAAALAGGVVVLFAGGMLISLYHGQIEAVDLETAVHRREITQLSREQLRQKSPQELIGLEPLMAIAVTDENRRLLRRSEQLPDPLARLAASAQPPRTIRDESGRRWRFVSFPVDHYLVTLGYQLDEVMSLVSQLLLSSALLFPVVLAVAGCGGWWVANRALRPLRDLSTTAAGIGVTALDRRVPVPPASDEVQRLATVINAMLARLEIGFHQAQRFAADASHELRTPLTIMHGEIERLLRTPQLDPTLEPKLLSLQEEIARLDRITQQLLLLTRFDSGDMPLNLETTNLSDLVLLACEDAELLAAPRRLSLQRQVTPSLVVQGDPAHLRRAVLTLLDNATRYNHDDGRVECHLVCHGAAVALRVRNTGPGIPPEARPQLFQRFFRADPARQRGGHGLGLSLAREIARAHRGDLVLAPSASEAWTEFVLTLPFPALPRQDSVGSKDALRT